MLVVRRQVLLEQSFAEPGKPQEPCFRSVFPVPFIIKRKFISSSTT